VAGKSFLKRLGLCIMGLALIFLLVGAGFLFLLSRGFLSPLHLSWKEYRVSVSGIAIQDLDMGGLRLNDLVIDSGCMHITCPSTTLSVSTRPPFFRGGLFVCPEIWIKKCGIKGKGLHSTKLDLSLLRGVEVTNGTIH